jgi:class 3 adenylate cyclase/HEAT repeat protein
VDQLTFASVNAQSQVAAMEALQSGSNLGPETKITTHELIRAFDRGKKGIEILHKDLFDSNTEVVLSALAALGTLGDKRSLQHIAKLLTQPNESILCAAVKVIGDIGNPEAVQILLNLFKVSKNEEIRCLILDSLIALCPTDERVQLLLRECYSTQLVSVKIRAVAARAALKLGIDEVDLSGLLPGAKETITEMVLSWATDNQQIRDQVLKYGAIHFWRLSAGNRGRLAALAAPCSTPAGRKILREALFDLDSSVRENAYRSIGENPEQCAAFEFIVSQLCDRADPDLSVEEEAISSIQRMEGTLSQETALSLDITKRIYAHIRDEYKLLSSSERRVGSDSHELGWLISRSREYLEYYGNEDLRQALLHFFKGSGYYTQDRILAQLKATAVKVEVRHFDGYRALVDIVRNPKRSGIGLIARELAIVKFGKQQSLYLLIRNLRLSRLGNPVDSRSEVAALFFQIFDWARQARIYRLAESALWALAKVDPPKNTDACLRCLKPPVFSKICAIAAIRQLHDLQWQQVEPTVLSLLSSTDDPHILLNLIDGLAKTVSSEQSNITKSVIATFFTSNHREVIRRAAGFLSAQSSFTMFENLAEMYDRVDSDRQDLILMILDRQIQENKLNDREAVVEFLYRILRNEEAVHRSKAVLLLWKLADDYAPKLLAELFAGGRESELISLVRGLKGTLRPSIIQNFIPLLHSENTDLHEAIRESLISADEEDIKNTILNLALAVRGAGNLECDEPQNNVEEVRIDFYEQKKAYRFEREYLDELAILFTDIVGFSKKAQSLSTLQLTTLIQEYENVLLPTLTDHGGKLIKKMGDGHLWIFSAALDAVLGAIRVQKALKRFNGYREQNQRIQIRIGIHWGKVVRKEGDVLGNHVNIASRLESAAGAGSILISEALYSETKEQIHVRDLGLIEVKGISESIRVFEPYEISFDLPEEMDPLKRAGAAVEQSEASVYRGAAQNTAPVIPCNGGSKGAMVLVDSATLSCISTSFSSLNRLCLKAEAKQIAVEEIRKELVRCWQKLKSMMVKGRSS